MPSFEELRQILTEVDSLKHSEIYSLRIAASFANRGIFWLADPVRNMKKIRAILHYVREAIKPFRKMEPNLARVDRSLEQWMKVLLPGPRRMDENPAWDNPIHLPGDDEVPGAMIYLFATQHGYSREFADEMVEWLIPRNYKAKRKEDVHFYLMHAVSGVKQKGVVFQGTKTSIEPVRNLFRQNEIAYDKYPTHFGYMIWVPQYQREEAKALIAERGLESL